MTTDTDVASTTDTQTSEPANKAQPAKPELKSTDTGVMSALREKADTATPQPKAPPPKEKPAAGKPADATPAVKGDDADSSEAEHPDDERKPIEPWMRKRLQRAEEKGRKLGRTETLDEVRAMRTAPAEPAKAESKEPTAAAKPKTLADFDYNIEQYNAHMIREGVQNALKERDEQRDREAKERTAEEARNAFEKRKREFEKRVGEGAWDDMVSASVDVPQEVIDLLTGHEKDLDIAHYLVHHTDELDKLKGKSKLQIARILTDIESRLGGSGEVELPPKTTKTPPPPPSVQGSGRSSKSIDDMTTAERIAHWRSQKESRRPSA